jgi:hypothetical protein
MKPYKTPKITVHGSLVDITKEVNKPAGKSDAFGSGILPPG